MANSNPEWITQLPRLAPRSAQSHKGSFGKVLLIAGSQNMSGAAVLAGIAALRGGAGLVQIAIPASIQPIVAAANPCYMTVPIAQDSRGCFDSDAADQLVDLASSATVVAIGPGLGTSEGLSSLIAELLQKLHKPVILDADGLNALANLPTIPQRPAQMEIVLTPHPGEMARLLKTTTSEVQQNRQDCATTLALRYNAMVVLKGHESLITDGTKIAKNTTGNPGMATGGTGDVLTGLIAALMAQGLSALEAAQLGVWVHGMAGDIAASHVGQVSLIATDLLQYLAQALQTVVG